MAPVFRFNNLMLGIMRRLGMAVAAVLLCATMGFARENRNNVSKEPFAINFEKLSNYLQLSSYQANEVANINEYFLDMQGESLRASEKMRDKKMRQAVYGNLKLMKKVLTPEQYRKYVVLLNVDK